MNPAWKRHPEIAAARKRAADSWREMRQENPAMARLVFRRLNEAEDALFQRFAEAMLSYGSRDENGEETLQ